MMAKLEGITSAKINFLTEKLTVESELPESELTAALLATAKSFSKKIELSRA
jgi:hypothetical protein